MSAMSSQITSFTIVYSCVYSAADQRKHQNSASLAFVRGIHRWPVNSPHKGPVRREMFPFDDVIMSISYPSFTLVEWSHFFVYTRQDCYHVSTIKMCKLLHKWVNIIDDNTADDFDQSNWCTHSRLEDFFRPRGDHQNIGAKHWCLMTQICISEMGRHIGLGNGSSPIRQQAIIWTRKQISVNFRSKWTNLIY